MTQLQAIPSLARTIEPRHNKGIGSRRVLLAGDVAGDDTNFEEIMALDNLDYVLQALELATLFQAGIKPDDLRFDFPGAMAAISQYNSLNPKKKVGIVGFTETKESQTNSQVSAMVGKVIEALEKVVGIALGATTVAQVTETITDAFTNLETQQEEAWIFWKSTDEYKTTYQYNVTFAIQNRLTGLVMLALAMGLEITVNKSKKEVLFITIEDKESYTVEIKAMKVAQGLYTGTEILADRAAKLALTALSPAADQPGLPEMMTRITDVQVKSWAGELFATASKGEVSIGPVRHAWLYESTSHKQLEEGQKYLIFSAESPATAFFFNGETEPGTLWFVSE